MAADKNQNIYKFGFFALIAICVILASLLLGQGSAVGKAYAAPIKKAPASEILIPSGEINFGNKIVTLLEGNNYEIRDPTTNDFYGGVTMKCSGKCMNCDKSCPINPECRKDPKGGTTCSCPLYQCQGGSCGGQLIQCSMGITTILN
jgi:hypothetical protein